MRAMPFVLPKLTSAPNVRDGCLAIGSETSGRLEANVLGEAAEYIVTKEQL